MAVKKKKEVAVAPTPDTREYAHAQAILAAAKEAKQVSDIECSMCGRDGGPADDCELCHGNKRFIQSRSYTLTEERQGKAPNDGRYSREGNVNPTVVVLPGGFDPRTGEK